MCHLSHFQLFGTLRPVAQANVESDGGAHLTTQVREATPDARANGTTTVLVFQLGASGTVPAGGYTVRLNGDGSYDPDGTIVGWAWDVMYSPNAGSISFSAATSKTTDVTFTGAGVHTIRLTVTDDEAHTRSVTVVVVLNRNPEAWFFLDGFAVAQSVLPLGTFGAVSEAEDPDTVPVGDPNRDPRDELYDNFTYTWAVDDVRSGEARVGVGGARWS